jgi:predicted RNA binding protein YcfA (HicA-like mRNA interferase family)
MKIPRDVSANQLVKQLSKFGYTQTRQVGSHIRLTFIKEGKSFHITIPNHNPLKIGTLNSILKDISLQLNISKQDLIKLL